MNTKLVLVLGLLFLGFAGPAKAEQNVPLCPSLFLKGQGGRCQITVVVDPEQKASDYKAAEKTLGVLFQAISKRCEPLGDAKYWNKRVKGKKITLLQQQGVCKAKPAIVA